jgi:hypothetical protein
MHVSWIGYVEELFEIVKSRASSGRCED